MRTKSQCHPSIRFVKLVRSMPSSWRLKRLKAKALVEHVQRSLRPFALASVCIALLAPSMAFAEDKASPFAAIVDRTFTADYDGSEQKYVELTPHQFAADKPISVLIVLHGHGSDRWQFATQMRGECRAARDAAAANGMLMITPDYRAKTSWMGPAAEADLLQIIRILKKQYQVERLIVSGASMGGSSALTFAALHPELVDGVVAINGTANHVEYERFQDAISKSFGGSKQEVPEEYRKRSAEFFPEKFTMPFAATTGGRDESVPPESVLRLVESLRKQPTKLLSIHRPEVGHTTSYDDTKRAFEFVIAASQTASRAPQSAGQ
ncbi:hypothetical protein Pla52o_49840 [Novipirellula galeiformis]|uniref:Peptidase S9 prolyl oligopeptidase catalytic domain-containing protein n=1 Tax=Novipirellula galeiformis TaxID=2528004 RepID=A0A5C6C4N8_9BACT|nr:hypothetical protein Pla52o_49840 [Novipirellula galeiformis]